MVEATPTLWQQICNRKSTSKFLKHLPPKAVKPCEAQALLLVNRLKDVMTMSRKITFCLMVCLLTPFALAMDVQPAHAVGVQAAQKKGPRKPPPKPGPRTEGDGE